MQNQPKPAKNQTENTDVSGQMKKRQKPREHQKWEIIRYSSSRRVSWGFIGCEFDRTYALVRSLMLNTSDIHINTNHSLPQKNVQKKRKRKDEFKNEFISTKTQRPRMNS